VRSAGGWTVRNTPVSILYETRERARKKEGRRRRKEQSSIMPQIERRKTNVEKLDLLRLPF